MLSCVLYNHTGPIVTFDSLWSNSGSAHQAAMSQTCWRHLLKQPCVWWVKFTNTFFLLCLHAWGEDNAFCLFFFLRAMIFAHLCHSSTHFTLLSWLPTFFKETHPHAKVTKTLGHFFVGHGVLILNDFKFQFSLLISWFHYLMLIGVNTGLGI